MQLVRARNLIRQFIELIYGIPFADSDGLLASPGLGHPSDLAIAHFQIPSKWMVARTEKQNQHLILSPPFKIKRISVSQTS